MMPTLSKAAEDRLAAALDDVADDPLSETDPEAAIEKAAVAHDIPHGHVALLCRAYNSCRSAFQRETAGTVAEKAAEFPVADADRVIARLYPDRPDTPAAAERRAGISPEYSLPPSWYEARRAKKAAPRLLELATRPIGGGAKVEPRTDPSMAFKRASAIARDAARAPERARTAATGLGLKIEAGLRKVAFELTQPRNPSLADVRTAAEVLHGATGAALVDEVARRRPELAKVAAKMPYHRPKDHPAIYGTLAELAGLCPAWLDAIRERDDAYKAAVEKIGEVMAPFLPETPEDELDAILGTPREKAAGPLAQIGVGLTIGQIRDMVDQLAGNYPLPDRAGRVQSAVNKLGDPSHESQLQDIETQYLLQNLLTEDPVISSHDPHSVADAYNEISRTVPTLARQPFLVRPTLRKTLEMDGLDTFEGGEAIKHEKMLRDLHGPQQPPAAPGGVNAKPNR